MEYTCIELSSVLCKLAYNKFNQNHSTLLKNGQIRIINDDISLYKPAYSGDKKNHYYIIFLEVLDNMPHDRVYYCNKQKDWVFQTLVDRNTQGKLIEEKVLISDPLISEFLQLKKDFPYEDDAGYKNLGEESFLQRIIKYYYKTNTNKSNMFIPTICLKTLKNLAKNIPNNHLIISDFDMLSNSISTRNQGINAPVVSKKLEKAQSKHDYDNYLIECGEGDIFFPTNFKLLRYLYKEICNKNSWIMKSHEFMKEFSFESWTETKSGYNPLKEDFLNTSFLVTDRKE